MKARGLSPAARSGGMRRRPRAQAAYLSTTTCLRMAFASSVTALVNGLCIVHQSQRHFTGIINTSRSQGARVPLDQQ